VDDAIVKTGLGLVLIRDFRPLKEELHQGNQGEKSEDCYSSIFVVSLFCDDFYPRKISDATIFRESRNLSGQKHLHFAARFPLVTYSMLCSSHLKCLVSLFFVFLNDQNLASFRFLQKRLESLFFK